MFRNRGGFTILEVMIFLAISGALLVAAIIAINGQQGRTAFIQAMRDIDSKLQDTLNDVSNGNFTYQNNQNCTLSGANIPKLSVGTGQIGSRSDCLFLGEALQFGTSGASAGVDNNSRFAIYTVLGRRLKTGGVLGSKVNIGSFNEANPTAMIAAAGSIQDLTSYYDFTNGITASHIYYTPSGGGVATDGVYTLLGLYTNFTSAANNVGNSSANGAQSLQTYVYKLADGTTFASTGPPPSAKICIDNTPTGAGCPSDQNLSVGASKGWAVCFDSNNGTKQTALLTIYNTSEGASTRLEFNPTGTCPAS